MDAAIQAEVDKLKGLIITAILVEQIYLFDSHAYGTPHKDSDLDFYVVLKDEVQPRYDFGLSLSEDDMRLVIAHAKTTEKL